MTSIESPSPWVERFSSLIPAGSKVLDLACGHGRHTCLLSSLGHRVEAVDRDAALLEPLAALPGVTTRCADLEGGPWPFFNAAFDAVIVTRYLYRPLIPGILRLLETGGVLIYETFMVGNEAFGKPSNPEYLLRSGELLELVKGRLTVVAFEQGRIDQPRPAMIQRICAIRAQSGRL